jgi:hypothetical protein
MKKLGNRLLQKYEQLSRKFLSSTFMVFPSPILCSIELLPSFHVEEATELYPFYVKPFFNFKFFANFEFYIKQVLRMSKGRNLADTQRCQD